MLAVSQSDGRVPVVSDSMNIAFSTGEISSAQILANIVKKASNAQTLQYRSSSVK